jgi:tripartite-type tricarboxylate transporter receptor subunit TctC
MRSILTAALLTLALAPMVASAQDPAAKSPWPARPIRLIVPFPPGSSPDLVARMLNDRLGQALGQPIVVENRPGAGGMVGTGAVAKAAPDGYTIGISIPGPLAVNTVLLQKMEYDPFRELAPITVVAASPNVLVVDPKLNVSTLAEFIAAAKSQPGKLNYGSVGNGSASHLTMELLKQLSGIDVVHVPYPGSPQVTTAILNGQIAGGFIVPATAMALVQAGRLKALGATTTTRSVVLPEMPTAPSRASPAFTPPPGSPWSRRRRRRTGSCAACRRSWSRSSAATTCVAA